VAGTRVVVFPAGCCWMLAVHTIRIERSGGGDSDKGPRVGKESLTEHESSAPSTGIYLRRRARTVKGRPTRTIKRWQQEATGKDHQEAPSKMRPARGGQQGPSKGGRLGRSRGDRQGPSSKRLTCPQERLHNEPASSGLQICTFVPPPRVCA
jgi:hypothetical protein